MAIELGVVVFPWHLLPEIKEFLSQRNARTPIPPSPLDHRHLWILERAVQQGSAGAQEKVS